MYCFELAPFPYIFLEQVCPVDTLELSHDAMALEGRGTAQALEHMLTEPLIISRLDGAIVNWYSDSQTLVDRLNLRIEGEAPSMRPPTMKFWGSAVSVSGYTLQWKFSICM